MNVSGIILAAGASRRMGTSKALLEYRGETFLARLRRLLAHSCSQVIVVGAPASGFQADAVNPDPERGMLSSLNCGLEHVDAESEAVLFTLVDLPAIEESTIDSIVRGWHGELLRIPRYLGTRGHPVLFSRTLIPEFLAATGTPKDIVARHESEIVYVDVDDRGVVHDADTPADYFKLVANG